MSYTPLSKKKGDSAPAQSAPARTSATPAPSSSGYTPLSSKGGSSPKKKSEKKNGGFFGDAFRSVTGLAGGLGRVVIGLGKELAPPNPIGAKHDPKSMGWQGVKKDMPITAELVTSPVRTIREVPDTIVAQRPSFIPGVSQGPGFGKSMLGKEIQEHGYFNTGLAKTADVMTIASFGAAGLAKIGLGGLSQAAHLEQVAAATSKAAKLGKVADAATLDKAAAAATKAGNAPKAADLTRAAEQVRTAQTLRAEVAARGTAARVGAKTAENLKSVGKLGGQIANAPAKPYTFVGGKIVAPLAKKAGKAAVDHSPAAAAAADAVGTALKRYAQSRQLKNLHYENVTAPEQAGQFRTRQMGGVSELSKRLDPNEQAALTIIRSTEGLDPAALEAFDRMTPEHQAGMVREMFGDQPVTTEAFQMAKDYRNGTLPTEQIAKLDDATAKLSDAIYTEHGRRYVEGDSTKAQLTEAGLAERAAQAQGGQPVPEKVARLTEQFQAAPARRIADIEAEAAAIRQRNLEPQTGTLSAAAKRQVARDEGAIAVRKSIERNERKRAKGNPELAQRRLTKAQESAATRVDRLQKQADRKAVRNDEKRLATLDEQRAGHMARMDDMVKKAEDDVRAAPAQDRPALEVNKRAAEFVRSVAKEYPDQAQAFSGLADDIATTTKELHAKGLHPEYTFGGTDAVKTSPVVGVGPKTSRKKLTSEQARTTGVLKRTVAGELDSFERETHTILQNKAGAVVQEQLGSTAGKVLREAGYSPAEIRAMSPEVMHKALAEAHAVPWQPTGSGGALVAKDVTVNSAVLPDYLHKQLTKYTSGVDKNATGFKVLRGYDKATGNIKHAVLALSPRWHVGNVMGNTILAGIGAGVTPAQMVRTLPEARRLAKAVTEGRLDDPGIVQLLASGFHADDLAQLRELAGSGNRLTKSLPGRTVGTVIHKSYDLNQSVDNIGRVMVYLAKKKTGVSSEAAVQMSLKAMGNFSRMTKLERNVVRRIVPFYSWQRHITQLTFRLPIESPARVAWTLHLADLGNQINGSDSDDDPFNRNSIKVGDKRLRLDQFNPFGSSTFVDMSLRGFGYQVNPILKAGVVAATGLSPNRGFQPLRTPEAKFGEGPQGGYGLKHPVRLGQYAAQTIPQFKAAQNFAEGDAAVRFETGQVDKKHKTGKGTLAQIAQLLGVPFPVAEQPKLKPKKKR